MSTPQPGAPAVRPRGIAFIIPIAIFVIGAAVGIGLVVWGFARAGQVVDGFDRVSVGESATVELEAGSYRIWLEGEGVTTSLEFFEGNIVPVGDADPITTEPYLSTLTYQLAGHEGTAVETLDLAQAGEYEISLDSVSSNRDDRNLAIGQENPLGAVGLGFASGLGVMGLCVMVAVVILIVMLVKRGRSKRALRTGMAGSPPGTGYGYPAPGYPPQPNPPPGFPPPATPPGPG